MRNPNLKIQILPNKSQFSRMRLFKEVILRDAEAALFRNTTFGTKSKFWICLAPNVRRLLALGTRWDFGVILDLVVLGFGIFYLVGCVTAPYKPTVPAPLIPGIYHRVEKGQTLWRICKIYNIDLDEITKINRISDAAKIEVGQLIFVPRRKKEEYPNYDSSHWEDFIWPLKGKVIASFGQTFNNMVNKGINIQPSKTQNVVAAAKGRVAFYANNFAGFGKTIIIDHNNGFLTVYARNSQAFVKVGDLVQKGTTIAKVGSDGRNKDRYLHFQIRKGHIPQNPYFYLSP